MSHDAGAVCLCQADHRPTPLEYEWHHLWPLAAGGPNTPPGVHDGTAVWVCPTAHTNVHEILRVILKRNGDLPWRAALDLWDVPVSRYAFELAHEGCRRMTSALAVAP